jgi:death-on-curing protein
MEFTSRKLTLAYKASLAEISSEPDTASGFTISAFDIVDAHFSIVDYFLEYGQEGKCIKDFGPRDNKRLPALVAVQATADFSCGGVESDCVKCAKLFYELVKERPFYSANNSTALLTALYYLAKVGLAPTASHKELEVITRIIASNTIRDRKAFRPYTKFDDGEIRFLAKYLQEHTRPVDNRAYTMTYKEFNRILRTFGFCMAHPHGDEIDLLPVEKRSSLLGFSKSKQRQTTLGGIPFSGWTGAVSGNDIRRIQEFTGLASEDGFDVSLISKSAPSPSSLINQYRDIWHSIADN